MRYIRGTQIRFGIAFTILFMIIALMPSPALAQNHAPVTDAGEDQELVVVEMTRLEGSATDPDGDPIIEYLWYVDSSPAGSTVSIQWPDYPDPRFYTDMGGDYVLGLIAFDGLDWSDPDFVTIHVRELIEPESVIIADVVEGPAPLVVHFDGSASVVDPIAEPLEYNWAFGNGDDSRDVAPTTVYLYPGTYPVLLTVVDARGGADSKVVEITVTGDAKYVKILSLTATPNTGNAPLTVQFNADAICKSEEPLTYEWDLDNDGEYDDATGESAMHTYNAVGVHTVGVRVTDPSVSDPDAGMDTSTTTVTVTSNGQDVPEFPTIVLPVAAILGMALIFSKRE